MLKSANAFAVFGQLTSLILSEINLFRNVYLICIDLSIETVILLQRDRELSSLCVDIAPISNSFDSIDLWDDFIKMLATE